MKQMLTVDLSNNLFRGPRPTDLRALKASGIKRVISLESGMYQALQVHSETYYENVMQFPVDFGIEEYNMPCSDITPPEDRVVEKILTLLCDRKPTYIHCLSGVDRTGYICAVYRMRSQGWSYAEALEEWKRLGRHPWYFWWSYKLKGWSK